MPRTQAQKMSARRKARAAAYFRRVSQLSKRQKVTKLKVLVESSSQDDFDLSKLMNQATEDLKFRKELNALEADTLALKIGAEMQIGGISAGTLGAVASALGSQLETMQLIDQLRAGMNETARVIGSEYAAVNRNIVQTLSGLGNDLSAADRAAFADAIAQQQELTAEDLRLQQQISQAIQAGDEALKQQLIAQREQASKQLQAMKAALAQQLKDKFDEIDKQLDLAKQQIGNLMKNLNAAKADFASLGPILQNAWLTLKNLPPNIFDPGNMEITYYCDGCTGIFGAGNNSCFVENDEDGFYLHAKRERILDGKQFRICMAKHDPPWEIQPGPYFGGVLTNVGYIDKNDPDKGPGFKIVLNQAKPGATAYLVDPAARETKIAQIIKECSQETLVAVQQKAAAAAAAQKAAAASAAGAPAAGTAAGAATGKASSP